ncbi:hypothetical protein EMIT0111MI5_50293 [Burkholderia sp. IT-111MI5]
MAAGTHKIKSVTMEMQHEIRRGDRRQRPGRAVGRTQSGQHATCRADRETFDDGGRKR